MAQFQHCTLVSELGECLILFMHRGWGNLIPQTLSFANSGGCQVGDQGEYDSVAGKDLPFHG